MRGRRRWNRKKRRWNSNRVCRDGKTFVRNTHSFFSRTKLALMLRVVSTLIPVPRHLFIPSPDEPHVRLPNLVPLRIRRRVAPEHLHPRNDSHRVEKVRLRDCAVSSCMYGGWRSVTTFQMLDGITQRGEIDAAAEVGFTRSRERVHESVLTNCAQ